MSDHFRTLTVVLADDFDDVSARLIASVIENIRGVASVSLGAPVNSTDHTARMVVRSELRLQLHKAVESVFEVPKP